MRLIILAIALLFCVAGCLGRALTAEADQPVGSLPDVLSQAAKEAFELLTAPRATPADMTIKIVGDQRHWSYTYTNPPGPSFKSTATSSIAEQMDADADLVVPQDTSVELLMTANDQIYEMTVQVLSVPLSAVPGRVQSVTLMTKNVGRLVGVCSSNCDGTEQADPIAIRVVRPDAYEQWLRNKINQKP